MKKYVLLFLCASLLSTLLYGCSSKAKETKLYDTPLYSIAEKDGQYNLIPNPPLSDVDASIGMVYPKFQSVAEMRQGIIGGTFTKQELYALSRYSPSADGGIEICNPDHLYDYTAPANLHLKSISWRGISYDFDFDSENVWGGICCYTEKQYTEHFNSVYKQFLTNPKVTLVKQEQIEERTATVYYCNTDVAKLKYICYEICVGNKKMYVQENYRLESNDDSAEVSSEIPTFIEFWGTENDGYFYGVFFEFTERPSVEWLCEFGLTPYADSTTD